MPSLVRKILVIDDERDFADVLKSNLETATGCIVVTAYNGREGLKLAREEKPDLILLDVMMPGLTGLDVLKRLKEDVKTVSIPVMMLTAVADDKVKERAGILYDEDYIEKPVQIDALKERINAVLSRYGK
ncbi:MAG: response regulator [Candidatus Omnitrophica bacterium]|nr:response regulator [Candidatus Omnitrophota bacterium]